MVPASARRKPTPAERHRAMVEQRGPDECWPWTGSCTTHGYGHMTIAGKQFMSHRIAYALAFGPIPPGLQIDHTCHNADLSCRETKNCPHRACQNPAHLEAVTNAVNSRRGRCAEVNRERESSKPICVNGHAFDEANTRVFGPKHYRACRTCARENQRRYVRERRA